jgi:hypothetical protein
MPEIHDLHSIDGAEMQVHIPDQLLDCVGHRQPLCTNNYSGHDVGQTAFNLLKNVHLPHLALAPPAGDLAAKPGQIQSVSAALEDHSPFDQPPPGAVAWVGAKFVPTHASTFGPGAGELPFLNNFTHQFPLPKFETAADLNRRNFAFIAVDLSLASSLLALGGGIRSLPTGLKIAFLAGSVAFSADIVRRAVVPHWREVAAVAKYGVKKLFSSD